MQRQPRSLSTILLFCLLPNLLPCQVTKIAVPSVDSALSKYKRYGFLSGRVTVVGRDIPLRGVYLSLGRDGPNVTTDANGFFAFGPLLPDNYILKAAAPGYIPSSRSLSIYQEKQLTFDVGLTPDYSQPGKHSTGGAVIALYDRDTGEPLPSAEIRFLELGGPIYHTLEVTKTIYHLAPGMHRFRISSWRHGKNLLDSIGVRSGQLSYFTLPLVDSSSTGSASGCRLPHWKARPSWPRSPDSLGTISGFVYDSTSHQGVSALVFLAPYGQELHADSTGRFVARRLPPGRYCLTVRLIGFQKKTEHGILVSPRRTAVVNISIEAARINILD
jgi:hypothetical protein